MEPADYVGTYRAFGSVVQTVDPWPGSSGPIPWGAPVRTLEVTFENDALSVRSVDPLTGGVGPSFVGLRFKSTSLSPPSAVDTRTMIVASGAQDRYDLHRPLRLDADPVFMWGSEADVRTSPDQGEIAFFGDATALVAIAEQSPHLAESEFLRPEARDKPPVGLTWTQTRASLFIRV